MENPGAVSYYPESSTSNKYVAPEQVHYVQQPPMHTGGQVQYVQHPYIQTGGQVPIIYNGHIDPSITKIRDWLPWSITNIFIGWLFVGIVPLIFSLICRSRKTSNNASGARTMSTLAFISNILVTLAGICGWIALIVALALAKKAVSTTSCYYYYC